MKPGALILVGYYMIYMTYGLDPFGDIVFHTKVVSAINMQEIQLVVSSSSVQARIVQRELIERYSGC